MEIFSMQDLRVVALVQIEYRHILLQVHLASDGFLSDGLLFSRLSPHTWASRL
jgi:hypothetical protein